MSFEQFFGNDNYEVPVTGSDYYFKPRISDPKDPKPEKIRIMGSFTDPTSAIMGWSAWERERVNDQNQKIGDFPHRFPYQGPKVPPFQQAGWQSAAQIIAENERRNPKLSEAKNKEKPKHFWALVIYNHETGSCQIWEITQASIQSAIRGLAKDPDWGAPDQYDISILRTGEGLNTEYTITGSPKNMGDPTKVLPDAVNKMAEAAIDVSKLFEGKDPFGANKVNNTAHFPSPAEVRESQVKALTASPQEKLDAFLNQVASAETGHDMSVLDKYLAELITSGQLSPEQVDQAGSTLDAKKAMFANA